MEQFFKLSTAIISELPSFSGKQRMNRGFICIGIFCLAIISLQGQNLISQTSADRLYASGVDLMEHNQFGGARQSFADFLAQSSPSDMRRAEAQYYEAFCALNLYHSDGEKKIEDFVKSNPNHQRTATAYYIFCSGGNNDDQPKN